MKCLAVISKNNHFDKQRPIYQLGKQAIIVK